MKKFKLPVSWEMSGEIEIEAEDQKDFMEKVEKYRENNDELGLPSNGEYIDASFVIADDDVILSMDDMEDYEVI